MKILITGASGFTAKSLIGLLSQYKENQMYGTDLLPSESGSYFKACNLGIAADAEDLIMEIKPDQIYHLAGSFSNQYEQDYQANVLSTKNILDSLLKNKLKCRTLLIGSAAEYGYIHPQDNPVKETQKLQPVSIYGLTKVYQTEMMAFYHRMYQSDVLMARLFNLQGKGMSEKLLMGKVYNQLEAFKKGEIPKIILGNLQSKRDYLSVEQAVVYYTQLMQKGKSGEVYNVASGKSERIEDIIGKILAENELDLSIVEVQKFDNPHKWDIEDIYADISKLNNL